MGCDIHIYAEEKNEEGQWVPTKKRAPNHRFGYSKTESEYLTQFDPNEYDPLTEAFDTGRNYDLFALLAGVRNYDDIDPISEPRGIPDNASEEVKEIVQSWDGDGHSHSWLLVSEVLLSEQVSARADDKWIKALRDIRNDHENARIVFFFDN